MSPSDFLAASLHSRLLGGHRVCERFGRSSWECDGRSLSLSIGASSFVAECDGSKRKLHSHVNRITFLVCYASHPF